MWNEISENNLPPTNTRVIATNIAEPELLYLVYYREPVNLDPFTHWMVPPPPTASPTVTILESEYEALVSAYERLQGLLE